MQAQHLTLLGRDEQVLRALAREVLESGFHSSIAAAVRQAFERDVLAAVPSSEGTTQWYLRARSCVVICAIMCLSLWYKS